MNLATLTCFELGIPQIFHYQFWIVPIMDIANYEYYHIWILPIRDTTNLKLLSLSVDVHRLES